jgi:GDP-4-dehydro-6-deoxy-D-mannose reductase
VCRGEAFRVGDLLESLIRQAQIPIQVRTDPARLRPNDNPIVLGSPQRLRQDTGWAPAVAIDDTLRDLLAHWRRQLPRDPQ